MKPASLFLTLALLIGSAPVFANESEAKAGDLVSIKVSEKVRQGDKVYKVGL